MKLGISTACLYPLDTIESLKILSESECKIVEVFFNTFSEIEPLYVKKLRKICDENGMNVVSVHPFTSAFEAFMLFTPYPARFYDMAEIFKKMFAACNELGAKIIVLHGDKAGGPLSDEEYFERFYNLAQVGREFGVTLTQENVNLFRANNVDFIAKMIENLGETAAFTFDVKQAVRGRINPFKILAAMGKNVKHVHVSDNIVQDFGSGSKLNSADDCSCMLPGAGDFDFKKMFEHLKFVGYDGACVLELYRACYGDAEDLVRACGALEDLI